MNKKYIGFALVAILALFLGACNMPGSEVDTATSGTPTPFGDDLNKIATQQAENARSAALTHESAPSAIPTNTIVPTLTATIAPTFTATIAPTFTPVPVNPYAWVDDAWDIVYSDPITMKPGGNFEGPGICEWYDGAKKNEMAFKATYDAASATVNVTELHEAMFPLMEGENYTYPSGIEGTCWEIDTDGEVETLMITYRHMLFYSNVYGNDSDQIKALKAEGKIWEGADVKAKPHDYMHAWLSFYNLGICNFRDQTSCDILALVIVQPPLGTSIKK